MHPHRLPADWRGVVSRSLAATAGGYVLAHTLPSALVLAGGRSLARSDAVLAALLTSFAVYVAAILWAFAARSAARAWAGLGAAVLLSGTATWILGH